MDSTKIQSTVIKTKSSNAEIVAKAIQILDAVENCNCSHCNALLKGALNKNEK